MKGNLESGKSLGADTYLEVVLMFGENGYKYLISCHVLGESLNLAKLLNNEVDIGGVESFYKGMHQITETALKHKKVQELFLDTNEEFDVCIVQWLYSDLNAG